MLIAVSILPYRDDLQQRNRKECCAVPAAAAKSISEMEKAFNRILPRKPGASSSAEAQRSPRAGKGARYDRSAALQKMTAAAVLTAVARMPAPTMEAGAALPYWLR